MIFSVKWHSLIWAGGISALGGVHLGWLSYSEIVHAAHGFFYSESLILVLGVEGQEIAWSCIKSWCSGSASLLLWGALLKLVEGVFFCVEYLFHMLNWKFLLFLVCLYNVWMIDQLCHFFTFVLVVLQTLWEEEDGFYGQVWHCSILEGVATCLHFPFKLSSISSMERCLSIQQFE